MTIWFDVEDLVRYFNHASRPTGIQRLSFELYRELWRQGAEQGEVKFCRRCTAPPGLRSIHFPALEAGIVAASERPAAPPESQQPASSRLAAFGRSLPLQYRLPLGVIFRAMIQIAGALRDLARAGADQIRPNASQHSRIGGHQFELGGGEVEFAAGDWLVNLGAVWDMPYDQACLDGLRNRDVRLAILSYDLIPELFPEWTIEAITSKFRSWLRTAVPQADKIFAISHSTANDLAACTARLGQQIAPAEVLPVGSFGTAYDAAPAAPERPYVLLVSTIEVRKNHALMFRVWRRMLDTMPQVQVPDLVFAGKIGWMTADFIRQVENCGWLNGRIRHVPNASESELASLYKGCLFTVFPSLYEGWGLPVTESLCFGKTVAASNRSSIPEAGGDFCVYYDPESTVDAYRVIRGLIEHPAQVAALEAKIAASFRPPSWADSAAALLRALSPDRQYAINQPASQPMAAD